MMHKVLLVWFGLVRTRLPELKVPNLHFSLMCSISSSEVPTPFEGGARATELGSSGALVERPLEWVLPLPEENNLSCFLAASHEMYEEI